jgi:hypothetical protein
LNLVLSEPEVSGLENDANPEVSRNEDAVILSDSSKSERDDEIACVGEQQGKFIYTAVKFQNLHLTLFTWVF